MLGDDDTCAIERTIFIEKYLNDIWVPSQIDGALYIPRLKKNLLSVKSVHSKRYYGEFQGRKS